ncbi:hypothetical protein [Comamonas sp. JC664]|uniref:hypothetical protein n=1 Tax=Comamonas sp. JC664 TaxID=2801917 RepID=UPI0036704CB3
MWSSMRRRSRAALLAMCCLPAALASTDFPRGNHQQLIDSITQRLWPMGDCNGVHPRPWPESSFGRERQSNPYVGGT